MPDASELASAAADAKRLKPPRLNHFFAIGQAISVLPPICNKFTDLLLIQIVFSLAHFEQVPRCRFLVSLRLMKLLQRNFPNSSGDMPLPVSDQTCAVMGQCFCCLTTTACRLHEGDARLIQPAVDLQWLQSVCMNAVQTYIHSFPVCRGLFQPAGAFAGLQRPFSMLQEPFSTLQNGRPEQVVSRYKLATAQINLQERHVSLQKGFSILHASFSSSRTSKSVSKKFFQICFAGGLV